MAIGAIAGYSMSFVTGMNLFLMMGIGIMVGSSIGVAWNIQRDKEKKLRDFETITNVVESQDSETSKINMGQKVS